MSQPTHKKRRTVYGRVTSRADPNALLDSWLELDRRIVELSMRRYGVPRRDRFTIRAQQRRLHGALRELQRGSKSLAVTDGLAKRLAAAA
jgi:hypothetical protein